MSLSRIDGSDASTTNNSMRNVSLFTSPGPTTSSPKFTDRT